MMIIPTIIILIITRSINLRIIQILKQMKKVKSQSFEPIQGEAYKDEIGQLTLEFNRMILQIRSLIHDVYLAEIQKKSLEAGAPEGAVECIAKPNESPFSVQCPGNDPDEKFAEKRARHG